MEGRGLEDDVPWADRHGKPIGKRDLASMFAKYNIRPVKIRKGPNGLPGYRRADLGGAWSRYLPPPSSAAASPEHPECPAPSGEI